MESLSIVKFVRRTLKIDIAFFVIFLFLLSAAILRFQQNPLVDEMIYHMKAIQQYIVQFPDIDLKHYNSASGPVPYIVWTICSFFVGSELQNLRVITFIFSLLSIFVLRQLLRIEKDTKDPLLLLLIVITPYYFLYSFTIYTMIISLSFGIIALYFIQRYFTEIRSTYLLFYVVFCTLAVLSRQFYLSYALGIFSFWFVRRVFQDVPNFKKSKETLLKSLVLALPILVLATFFIYWGSTNPPGFEAANAIRGINILQLNFIFIFLGFWFFPLFVDNIKKIPLWLLALAVVLSLHLLFSPLYITEENVSEGVICRLFEILQHYVPLWLLRIGQMTFWIIGLAIAFLVLKSYKNLYSYICFYHFGILLFIPQVWERYYLPVIPILWISLREHMNRKLIYYLWIIFQALIVLAYSIFKLKAIQL